MGIQDKNIDRESNVDWNDEGSDINRYDTLHDKWNDIQEEYFRKYPELEIEDLYFESGGFEGTLEKISELRGNAIEEIRSEIENL